MVNPKAALARDRLGEWRDGRLVQVFDRAAGGANQVVMMPGLAPHVGRDMTRPLEPLRQAGGDQGVERSKDRSPADVCVLFTDPLVEFLGRGFFARLRQHRRDGETLGCQPDAGLLQRGLRLCLNHSQMIRLAGFVRAGR